MSQRRLWWQAGTLALTLMGAPRAKAYLICYVDANAPGVQQDGLSWATAFTTWNEYQCIAHFFDPDWVSFDEVRIAHGRYIPGPSRMDSFFVYVPTYGGFAGYGAINSNERDPIAYPTILSGDINGNDYNYNDPTASPFPNFLNYDDNSYTVVYMPVYGQSSKIDGFIIQGGNNDRHFEATGGGIRITDGSNPETEWVTINNCLVRWNSAQVGGGVGIVYTGYANIIRTTITENIARALFGGGIFVGGNSVSVAECILKLWNSSVTNNVSLLQGGGIAIENPDPSSIYGLDVTIGNTLIAGNTGSADGGVHATGNGTKLKLVNATIVDNVALSSGGGGIGIFDLNQFTPATVDNTIIRGNISALGGQQIDTNYHIPAFVQVRYSNVGQRPVNPPEPSDINGTVTFSDSIDADAQFIDADGADNNRYTIADNDYRLISGSPGVDRGNNTYVPLDELDVDIDGIFTERAPIDRNGVPRFADDPLTPNNGVAAPGYPHIADLGAFEYHPPVSPLPVLRCVVVDSTNGNGALCGTLGAPACPAGQSCGVFAGEGNGDSCRKNRYISFQPNNPGGPVAFRVDKAAVPPGIYYPDGSPGGSCWVQAPQLVGAPFWPTAVAVSQCGASPVFRDWEPVIHLGDCEIIPVANYTIFTVTNPGGIVIPGGLAISTIAGPSSNSKLWGDATGPFNGSFWPCPDGLVCG